VCLLFNPLCFCVVLHPFSLYLYCSEMSAPIAINVDIAQLPSMSLSSSPGLYVPIHKRTGSNTSSPSCPSSPSSTFSSDTPSSLYSIATLLSLRPFADESVKGKIQASCPEVVMSRKMRKGLEYNGRTKPQLPPMQASLPTSTFTETKVTPTLSTPNTPLRVLPKRSRPVVRAPERRRNAFSNQNRRGLTNGDNGWRLQAMSISQAVLLV